MAKSVKTSYAPPGAIVAALWNDAWYSDFLDDQTHAPLQLEVVGHVMQHDVTGLRLCMERCPAQTARPRQIKFIPAGMLARLEILRKP